MSHCIVHRRVLIIYKRKLQKRYKKSNDFCSQEYMYKNVSVGMPGMPGMIAKRV